MLQKGYKKLDLGRKWMNEYVLIPELTCENNCYNKLQECRLSKKNSPIGEFYLI